MELARNGPNRSPFNKLPVQVLEHIFLKGCEMEIPGSKGEIYVGKHHTVYENLCSSRRLKPFALTVRSVCSKWKSLIDSEENFSLMRYWYAGLVLVIPFYTISRRTDQGEKREHLSFAKQIIQFRSQLTSSPWIFTLKLE